MFFSFLFFFCIHALHRQLIEKANVMEGWVRKRADLRQWIWKTRYLVLDPKTAHLHYFGLCELVPHPPHHTPTHTHPHTPTHPHTYTHPHTHALVTPACLHLHTPTHLSSTTGKESGRRPRRTYLVHAGCSVTDPVNKDGGDKEGSFWSFKLTTIGLQKLAVRK